MVSLVPHFKLLIRCQTYSMSGQIILRICILNCQVYRLHLTNTDKNKHDVPTGLIKRITVRLLTMMWLFNLVKGNISFNFATL
jgi:hypothetical protein